MTLQLAELRPCVVVLMDRWIDSELLGKLKCPTSRSLQPGNVFSTFRSTFESLFLVHILGKHLHFQPEEDDLNGFQIKRCSCVQKDAPVPPAGLFKTEPRLQAKITSAFVAAQSLAFAT